MPIVVVGRRDVNPSTSKNGAEQSNTGNKLGTKSARASGQEVPEGDEGETGAGGDGDEDLKDGALRVAVANGGGNGGEPFVRVSLGTSVRRAVLFRFVFGGRGGWYVVLVLDNLFEM